MKNALKKAISILLAAVMVFGAAPLAGFVGLELPSLFDFRAEAASYSGTCGMNLTWKLNNGHLSISGNGDMRNWDGSDFAPWYPYNESIYSVEIGDGVTSIGKNAFMYCAVLTSVTFGDSVTKIGDWAFHNCTRLNTISFPDTVTSIGGNALIGTGFRKNSANWENGALYCGKHLTEVSTPVSGSYTIKEGTLSIADGVFYNFQGNLDGLINVTLPDSLKSIGSSAFYNCIGLTNITIPNGVKTIGKSAFESTSLSEIIIPDGTTSIGYRAFYNCSNLKNAEISDSVTLIGDNVFYDCVSLETVTIGKGVETIGYNAFFDCTNITDVFYNGTQTEWNKIFIDEGNEVLLNANIHCTQTEITGDCGDNLTWKLNLSTGELVIRGTGDMYNWSTYNFVPWYSYGSSIKSVTIENGVTSIGDCAFYRYKILENVTIGDSVTSIGNRAFYECTNLANLTIGNGVTSIGDGAFYTCDNLTSVTIPDSVMSIGSMAFLDCDGLASVTIGNSVTSISSYTFDNCDSLKDVYYSGTQEGWSEISIGSYNHRLLNANIHFNHIHAVSTVKESADPTCTENGYKTGECVCGYSFTEIVPALNHKDTLVQVDAKAPTCTEIGWDAYEYCTACTYTTYAEKVALKHDIVVDKAVDATCTETGLTEGQHCSRCDDMTAAQEVVPVKPHNYIAKHDSTKHWKECTCGSIIDEQNHSFIGGNTCSCGFKRVITATIKIKNNNGSKTINYGETLKLTVNVNNKPSNAKIYWYVDGEKKGEGEVFNIKFENGTKIITVKLVDGNGVVYQNANGDEITDFENITVKVGFFQKLISFFKNLFGMNRTVVQTIFKGMY